MPGRIVFLYGASATGKSHFVKYIKELNPSLLEFDGDVRSRKLERSMLDAFIKRWYRKGGLRSKSFEDMFLHVGNNCESHVIIVHGPILDEGNIEMVIELIRQCETGELDADYRVVCFSAKPDRIWVNVQKRTKEEHRADDEERRSTKDDAYKNNADRVKKDNKGKEILRTEIGPNFDNNFKEFDRSDISVTDQQYAEIANFMFNGIRSSSAIVTARRSPPPAVARQPTPAVSSPSPFGPVPTMPMAGMLEPMSLGPPAVPLSQVYAIIDPDERNDTPQRTPSRTTSNPVASVPPRTNSRSSNPASAAGSTGSFILSSLAYWVQGQSASSATRKRQNPEQRPEPPRYQKN